MGSNPYSDLKAAWHLDSISAMRRGEQIVPHQVQLILSDLCNQDCHFCAYRMSSGFSSEQFVVQIDGGIDRNPKRIIPEPKAAEIIRDCAELGVGAIQFTGGGEPTVHPQHMELFDLCLSLGMEASLVTNGVILRKGWEEVLPRFSWIRVSIDAGSPEVYARIRNTPKTHYAKALENTSAIASRLKMEGSACLLGAGYVITRDNWEELEDGVSDIRDTGASYVRLSAMFSKEFDSYYEGVESHISDAVSRCKRLETESFKVIDLFGERISDLKQHAPDYSFCGYQQFNMYVGGNLKVYRCCNTSYTARGEVGDLSNQTLKEWFSTSQKKDAYQKFDARSCEICQFNSKNRVINYLVGEKPTHAEFV